MNNPILDVRFFKTDGGTVDFPRFSRQLIMSEITKKKLNEKHQIYRVNSSKPSNKKIHERKFNRLAFSVGISQYKT